MEVLNHFFKYPDGNGGYNIHIWEEGDPPLPAEEIFLQYSDSAPTLESVAWIDSGDSDTVIFDPQVKITLESGRIIQLVDSDCRFTVDGKAYTFVSGAEPFDDEFVTLAPDTISADDTVDCCCDSSTATVPATVPATIKPCCCKKYKKKTQDTIKSCDCNHSTLTVDQINDTIDNFFNTLVTVSSDTITSDSVTSCNCDHSTITIEEINNTIDQFFNNL